jgi:hypothetical protein
LEHEIEHEEMGDLVKIGIANVETTPRAVGIELVHPLVPKLSSERGLYQFSLAKYWRWKAT